MTAAPVGRSRFGLLLAAGQVRYQLLLLLRSPIGTFTALVVPLMVLLALNVATPQVALRELRGVRYADFLAPAIATFALLNACYVNTITSVVLAREQGVLKRLHGTPLPLWAYFIGRLAAAAVAGVASVAVVLAVGTLFMDIRLHGGDIAALAGVIGLGILAFTTLGLAVSTLVPRPETALPIAYGTMLPLAFISDVFFPATAAPDWLRHAAAAFPLSPIAKSAEQVFTGSHGWPMSPSQLTVTLCWTAGAALLTSVTFRWQPGASIGRPYRVLWRRIGPSS
jgi:ABC-2 type transport system permease protein